MKVVKYFENEAKKSKGHTKATSTTGCVVKTIHELAGLLLMYYSSNICQRLKVHVIA